MFSVGEWSPGVKRCLVFQNNHTEFNYTVWLFREMWLFSWMFLFVLNIENTFFKGHLVAEMVLDKKWTYPHLISLQYSAVFCWFICCYIKE